MECPRCQYENPVGMRFCGQCAASLAFTCPSCGVVNPPENQFCGQCATLLGRPAQPRFPSPDSYTPSHLVWRIFVSKSAIEGERKQVTVLFADVKGSMELLANRDPDEARKMLDPVLERMMESVHRYEGTVNQVMGDGIMALFGAPLAHEDHAIRACYAALRMLDSVRRYAEGIGRVEGVPVRIRVGLNSGEVVVRSIRNDLRMDYSAIGQTTHLAARMEEKAVPGTILITSNTFELAESYVQVKSLGPVQIKGLSGPVETYELLGAKPTRSRLRTAAARGLTRFVGRSGELQQLGQAVDQAYEGRGQVLAVVGEPGVGKSRLLFEFTPSHRADRWLILHTWAVSHGTATSYLPVIDLLKEYFQIVVQDDPQSIREKLTKKLMDLDKALQPTLPAFLALMEVPVDDVQWQTLDPPQRRQRTLEAVKRLFLRESEAQPLLLVFEDLHWIDAETQVLLNGLVEGLPTARLLLLVSYRPEYRHAWGSKTYYTQLRIDPLTRVSAEEMLDALMGRDVRLGSLKRLLAERTEGNPFFLEESVRTLVETEVLIGEPGAYQAMKSIAGVRVPATVEAVLASRIDRLLPEDKRLLQSAAVVGNHVPLGILQEIADISQDELHEALARLQASEFLYETRLFPDLEYTFKHALTQEVAYQMLVPDRRRALHAAVLRVGELFYAGQANEKADWLAFHALRGEVWDRAMNHLQRATARALARAAHRVAAHHLENALVVLDRLPSSTDRTKLAYDLRIDMRHALTPLGLVQHTLEHLRVAEALAIELDDPARLGRVVSFITNCLVLQGRYAEALATGQRALSIARELEDRPLQIASQMYIARARLCRGEYGTAVGLFHELIRSLDERSSDDFAGIPVRPAAFVRSSLASTLAELGAFEEAEAYALEAIRRAEASGQPDSVLWARWGAGLVLLTRGRAEEAMRVFDDLLALCRTHDLDAYVSRSMAGLGCAKARVGQAAEGLVLLEQAVALDASAEPKITHSFALTALAEAYFLVGDLRKALVTANEALQQARAREERAAEAYAAWILALSQSAGGGDVEVAEGTFRTAAVIASELRLEPLLAHCWLGLADFYEQRGHRGEANEHRERSRHLFNKLGIPPWIPPRCVTQG
jgi:class 3 adenylate cyclase/tetratricopeptide (TPR) repeat protein